MMPKVVRFSCSQSPFQVTVTGCNDLTCDCTELSFLLREVGKTGELPPDGLNVKIRVDAETWQEVAAPPRDPVSAQMVRELLDDYPASEKERLQYLAREKRRIAHRLRDYRFPEHVFEEGGLIAFREILSDELVGDVDASLFAYQWEHGGDLYLLDDFYCPNPACRCQEVHVTFLRCRDSGTGQPLHSEDCFDASMTLDGEWRIDHCYSCTEVEAKALLRAWRKHEPNHPANFSWRYQKVKEIARRGPQRRLRLVKDHELPFEPALPLPWQLTDTSFDEKSEDEPVDSPVAGTVRVGRNEPCPCGSGKKYKKCCGRPSQPQ